MFITQDLRYSVRLLMKSPVTTIVAIVSLALGIGANSAIFSLMNALIFRPLPVSAPSQLVRLTTTRPRDQNSEDGLSLAAYETIRKSQKVFAGLFSYTERRVGNP